MIDFDDFVNGPILDGDLAEAMRMWRREYKSARSFGWSALHLACWYISGDREGIVQWLLGCECDIEAYDEYTEWRPLHVCASYGNEGAMRVLLDAGCDYSAITAERETALQIAERENHHECALMLKVAVQVSVLLELLKNKRLSIIVEPETGKTLLDKLLDCKDQRVLKAIKAKQVDEQEIEEWKSLKLSQLDPQSLRSLHECLMFRCIDQNYDYGVHSLCTVDIINEASLFMGPTALETAMVWVQDTLGKLAKVDSIMPQLSLEYNPGPIISYITISISDIKRETIYSLCIKSDTYIYTFLRELSFSRSDNPIILRSQLISKSAALNFSSVSCGNSFLKLLKLIKEGNINERGTNGKKRVYSSCDKNKKCTLAHGA